MENKEKSKKVAMLKQCRDEYLNRKDECELITIKWKKGDKSGIKNKELIENILQHCADHVQEMINDLEGKAKEKFKAVIIKDDFAARIYDEEGIEELCTYCEENYVSYKEVEFETKKELDAYLQGVADMDGNDERGDSGCAVIIGNDLNKFTI